MKISFIRRGFACEDRAPAEAFQTCNCLQSRNPTSRATRLRNNLSFRGLRKQSPYALLFLFLYSVTFGQDIVVRTNISPESVWVGQRMTLQIDVLGKDGWAQITDIDAVEIPNCYILPSGNSRVRLQEKIEGADYSGQRYELSLYPQRNGSIEIPALSLPVKIQIWGAGTNEQIVSTKPRTIEAKLPAGVQNVHSFVASSNFTATQTWSSDATDFKVGEALKRSIQFSADNLPAMLLPTIAYPEIEYLSNYPETPELSDESAQSTPVGKRSESITYVFESNGTAELPTYSFQWWNPDTETLQTITLLGRSVQLTGGVAAATPSNPNPASQSAVNSRTKYTIGILTILSVSVAFWLLIRHRSKRGEEQPTEKTLFQQLSQSQDNTAYLQQALIWVDSLTAGRLSLSDFAADFADTSTQATVASLLRDPTQNSDLAALKSGLRTARAHYLKQQAQQQRLNTVDRQLPPLNG